MTNQQRISFITVTLIVILGFAVYGNSLGGKFIWDDEYLIKDNAYIKNFSQLPNLFTKNIAEGAGKKYNLYRPLQMITYMADYSIWRLNPYGYHLVNVFLHILVGLSIYWLVKTLFNDGLLAACSSILFVVHPVHTEVVSYISGRSDSLALLFILLCFICYIKYLSDKRASLYVLMLITYILALFSREISLILPALLLLYHYTFKKELSAKGFLPILIIAFGYCLLRVTALKDLLGIAPASPGLRQRIPGFFVALINYLRILFVPSDLHMEYGTKLFSFREPKALLGILALFALLIYAFTKRKTNRLVSFSIFWFFVALLPVSNLFPINAYMAEHWLYMPAIGFFLLLAKFTCYIFRQRSLKPAAGVFFLLLVCFYSYLTIRQNRDYWQEPIIFYERTLQYSPDSTRMYNNLAVEYSRRGRYQEAAALYQKALAIDPSLARVYNNVAMAKRYIGKPQEIIALLEKSIELDPTSAKTYNNLAVVYRNLGKPERAIPLYKKSIELDPASAKTYSNLANTYAHLGKPERAIPLYKKAIELDPAYMKAYNKLVEAYLQQKQYKLAIKYYDQATELGLNDPALAERLAPHRH